MLSDKALCIKIFPLVQQDKVTVFVKLVQFYVHYHVLVEWTSRYACSGLPFWVSTLHVCTNAALAKDSSLCNSYTALDSWMTHCHLPCDVPCNWKCVKFYSCCCSALCCAVVIEFKQCNALRQATHCGLTIHMNQYIHVWDCLIYTEYHISVLC